MAAVLFVCSLQNFIEADILNIKNIGGEMYVYFIGKINRKIYRCISEDIVTDEVIITDNQIQHIKSRHVEAYERIIRSLRDVISDPDYIIKDKHKYTGLVIKRIAIEEYHIQLVLRICTSEDTPGYKNSIISCWQISESRLNNYLRNKKILYRKL